MSQSRSDLFKLVAVLADGQWHSGESLGRQLGITRAAVWKRLQSLKTLGLDVSSVKGQGYRLDAGASLLNREYILDALQSTGAEQLTDLLCFYELTSTNQYLLEEESRHAVACLAECQTAGRGRRGRQWASPFAANIYLSLRWHYSQGVVALEGLSLAVGVVIAEVLASLGLVSVKLKWPNDVLCDGRKLGGVLVEVGGDLNGDCVAVVGLGINVNMREAPPIEQAWTDLSREGLLIDRSVLAAALIDAVADLLHHYPERGFAYYRQAWLQFAAYLGESVVLLSGRGERRGVFRDIDERGAFAFECDGQLEWVQGGEISLRGQHDLQS